jgi:hypothetical protein
MTLVDEHGHALENDYEGRNGCPHGKEATMKSEARLEQGTATMGHAEPMMPDVSGLMPKDGVLSPLTLVLVGMVLASGLALKLFPAWLDHKTKKAQADSKKPDCSTKHKLVEEQVKAQGERLSATEERATVHEARISVLEQKEEDHES